MEIVGIEGMSDEKLQFEIQKGGKFIIYQYTISLIAMTFRRSSKIFFVKADEGNAGKAARYTAVSFFFGWWGIPWGPIYTIQSIFNNLSGGKDITKETLEDMKNNKKLIKKIDSIQRHKEQAKADTTINNTATDGYAGIISQAAEPFIGDTIHVGQIPEEKEMNIRLRVLPDDFTNDPIIAAFDYTVMGSAKDALVFTPTHCFVKDFDTVISFKLEDLTEVIRTKGRLSGKTELCVKGEKVTVPIGGYFDSIPVVFQAIVGG